MGTTSIEWADFTFNPWSGCAKVSAGCTFCYAAALPPSMRRGAEWGESGTRIPASESYWAEPLKWARKAAAAGERRRVFCASTADVFEDWATLDPLRERLWELIGQTPELDWLLLTKRPKVMAWWAFVKGWPRNAWAGTSVEDQRAADERIPHLLRVPARVRFLSCEPLLGPVDLSRWIAPIEQCAYCAYEQPGPVVRDYCPECEEEGGLVCAWGEDQADRLRSGERYLPGNPLGVADCAGGWPEHIDWVIAGGESGRHARPMHPVWARGLRDQCVGAGVPFHFKQWGGYIEVPSAEGRPGDQWLLPMGLAPFIPGDGQWYTAPLMRKVGKLAAGRELDGRTWDELPAEAG